MSVIKDIGSLLLSALLAPLRGAAWLFNLGKSLVGGILSILTTSIGVFTTGLKVLLVPLAGVVGGLGVAFKSAIDSMGEFSKSALSIRAGTGLSYGAAGGLLTRGLAFGMSPSDTASAFGDQNPLIASLRGNNYQSPNYLSGLSREYNGWMNQGGIGTLIGQALLRGRGVPDSVREIAAMNPDKVAAQEKWSNNITGRLGLNGKSIAQYAEDFQLAGNKVKTILELLKLKFADAFGPQLIAGIEKVAQFLSDNAERISRIAERIGGALSGVLLRGLGVVLAYLDKNAGKIEGYINEAFDWLLFEAPALFLNAGSKITGALAWVFGKIGGAADWLVKKSPEWGKALDQGAATLGGWVPKVLSAFDAVINGFRDFVNSIAGALNGILTAIEDFVRGLNLFIPEGRKLEQPKFKRLPEDIFGDRPRSDMAHDPNLIGAIQGFINDTKDLAKKPLGYIDEYGPDVAKNSNKLSAWLEKQSISLAKSAKTAPDDVRELLKEQNQLLKENTRATRESVEKVERQVKAVALGLNVLGVGLKYKAEDAALVART